MNLLIVTQEVDQEGPLGFFHRWLIEFARHVDTLTVICLYEGVHALPENVTVHSLGKERGRRSSWSYALSFIVLAWQLRDRYTHVFVHMNPEYLILAGPMWKVLRKKTALWYMHKTVSVRLVLGILCANVVFTASPRSMRFPTGKKRVVGHGIQPSTLLAPPTYPPLSLLTVGRLSRIKHVETLIETLDALKRSGIDAYLTIVGAPTGEEGSRYEQELQRMVAGLALTDRVQFEGGQPHAKLEQYFGRAHLFLHASDTGSLDKASLEPLSAGVPIITVDQELAGAGIRAIIGVERSADAFAGTIRKTIGTRLWDDPAVRKEAHEFVHREHELTTLIPRILADSRFISHR